MALRLGNGVTVTLGPAYVVSQPGDRTDLLSRTPDRVTIKVSEHHLVTEPDELDADGATDASSATCDHGRCGVHERIQPRHAVRTCV